jgi:hypothetical protein
MRLDMETQLQVEAEPQAQQPAQASTPARAWSLPTRLAFRFGFVYLVLYGFPGPLGFLPGADWIFGWYVTATQKLVIWTGAHVLHLGQPVQYVPTGSGDTLHNYIENLLILAIAVVAMLVWSVLDRKRREYTYLYQWLRFYVRLVLGATLLCYGAAKVIKSQFPNPFLARYS